MDLAGQKLRTGLVVAGPAVRHLKVRRDCYGAVVEPATVLIGADTRRMAGPPWRPVAAQYRLTIPAATHEELLPDDRLSFTDTRGKRRHLEIAGRNALGSGRALPAERLSGGRHRFEWYRRGTSGHYRFGPGVPLIPSKVNRCRIRLFAWRPAAAWWPMARPGRRPAP